jgi:glutamate racemase
MKLGVFDSGLGGLTVVGRLRELLPQADMYFFSDQAHVPYGERSAENLAGLLRANVAVLAELDVDAIVMGCNTTCAIAAEFGWPPASMPIFDLLEAGAQSAAASGAVRYAVLATNATVRTKAYTRALQAHVPAAVVEECAAPDLVPLIEAGSSLTVLQAAVARALHQFTHPYDVLVLGCSHYPLLRELFAQALPQVKIIDPAVAQAERVALFARTHVRRLDGAGAFQAWTNGEPAAFADAVKRLGFTQPTILFGAPMLHYASGPLGYVK